MHQIHPARLILLRHSGFSCVPQEGQANSRVLDRRSPLSAGMGAATADLQAEQTTAIPAFLSEAVTVSPQFGQGKQSMSNLTAPG